MNIETPKLNKTQDSQKVKASENVKPEGDIKFSDELKNCSDEKSCIENEIKNSEEIKNSSKETKSEENGNSSFSKELQAPTTHQEKFFTNNKDQVGEALNSLKTVIEEFNQSEDNNGALIKNHETPTVNNDMINNDFNIQENKDLLPQMNPNMNFSGNGQPFSSFMENKNDGQNSNKILGASKQDLAEEAEILSTMAENIAIANKKQLLKDTQTIINEEGIKKVDSQSGIKIETIVKFDNIIINQADVEVFVNLVENKEIDINNLAPKALARSIHVSKTLANMLAKSMENNQPLRIDFDNDISVIIKISRDGKITADFLPSSQVAEAYLKENLPLLRQRFDDNNIEYESLNQRERKDQNKQNNRKKDRNNE